MQQPIMTPRALLRQITYEVADEQRVDPMLIEDRLCRLRKVVRARATIAARLFDRGIKVNQIANMMKRDRPTVLDYLREMQREAKMEDDHGNHQDRSKGSGASGAA